MDNWIIKTEDLQFSYDDDENGLLLALNGVDLEIEAGSFVAVTGRNGSGKSTLAKNLNAILLPTGGAVYVQDKRTDDDAATLDIRRTVGMVFQNPDNQLVSSVVEDDVAFGPENLGIDPAEIRQRVDRALKAVGMYEQRKKGPHLLSGGQKQRVAIAGVLAMRPSVIVFDEPTAMLDPRGRAEIMSVINYLHGEGHTIVLITHFMEEAAQADRIIVMSDGKVALDGTPADIFAREEEIKALRLELPFAVDMAQRLRARGFSIPQSVITEEELADAICRSM